MPMSQKDLFQRGSLNLIIKITGQLLNLALIPIYVEYLMPSHYGVLNVGYVYLNFFVIFAVFGMNESITRFYPSANDEDKGRIFRTAMLFTLLWAAILFAFHLLFLKPLTLLFMDDIQWQAFYRLILLVAFLEALNLPVTMMYHVEKRNGLYALALLGKNSIKLILSWYLIKVTRDGIEGAALALLSGSVVYFLPMARLKPGRLVGPISFKWLKKLLNYGAPFLLTSLAMNALFQIDQLIIKFLKDFQSVAVYGMAYKLGSAIQYINTAFALVWFPHLFSVKRDEARQLIPRTLFNYLRVVLPVAIGLTVGARYFLPYFLPDTYRMAVSIIPWVIWGYVAYSLSDFLGAGLFINLKSHRFSFAALTALLVNIVLNMLWIPVYGVISAAWSTFISMSLLSMLTFIWSQRTFKISFGGQPWARLLGAFVPPLLVQFLPLPFPDWLSGLLFSLWMMGAAYKTGAWQAVKTLLK
ncbi:MAG: hypothetical protein D6677_07470 [Calditrichaeota bacterium]|nr:MAG: hypothetical protein D6677_07470 [Calditrichota bacterium]